MNIENTDLEKEDTATECKNDYIEKTLATLASIILFAILALLIVNDISSRDSDTSRERYADSFYQLEEIGLPVHGILGEASDVPQFYSESPDFLGWTTSVGGWNKGGNTYVVSVTMAEEMNAFEEFFSENSTTRILFHFDVSSGTPELKWSHAIESSEREYSLASLGWMNDNQLRSIPFSKKMTPLEMDRIQTVIEQRLWGVGVEQESELDN